MESPMTTTVEVGGGANLRMLGALVESTTGGGALPKNGKPK
jgi:hypothetical protein